MTAEEYFDSLKSAVRDREALAARIEAMGEPYVGSSLSFGSGSGGSDPMARYDRCIDMEPSMRRQMTELDTLIREGRQVISGIGRVAGQSTALILELYYVGMHTWFEISIELHVSMSTCIRRRAGAFALFEERGFGALRDLGAKS